VKRLKRDPAKLETLALFALLAQDEGYSFKNEETGRKFINDLETEFLA
jgi:hypothetical protein